MSRGWEKLSMADVSKLGRKATTLPQERRSKYRAVKTTVDGITFDSKREAARYVQLKAAERAGYLVGLELQPRFELRAENGGKVAAYVADFAYWEKFGGSHLTGNEPREGLTYVVEDVKGFKTPAYRLKKKHFEAQYGIQIREVR